MKEEKDNGKQRKTEQEEEEVVKEEKKGGATEQNKGIEAENVLSPTSTPPPQETLTLPSWFITSKLRVAATHQPMSPKFS